MFKKNDPYTFATSAVLQTSDPNTNLPEPIGQFSAEYQVTHYDDVQLSSGVVESGTNNEGVRKYLLTCTQRIRIKHQDALDLRPEQDVATYSNYPALLLTSVAVGPQSGIVLELVKFDPQTVNSQVQTSGSTGSNVGTTAGTSTSNTVGSSTSQTNGYSVSVGFTGDILSGSVSAEHSTTTSSEHSRTVGSENSRSSSHEASSSSAMSIKDWGAYCLVDPVTSTPWWTFGQEYPWDAIRCRKTDNVPNPNNSNQVHLLVPDAMAARLQDGDTLYPPSHLSMFGINFVMKAQWLVTVTDGNSDTVKLQHNINYFAASHSRSESPDSSPPVVYLDSAPTLFSAQPANLDNDLDLGMLGLSPLGASGGPAIIAFLPSNFTTPPIPAGSDPNVAPQALRAFSSANNLRITDTTVYPSQPTQGAGFSSSETSLTAVMTGNCTQLQLSMLFKVIDVTSDYTLFIKHWKTFDLGAKLSIVINGDTSNPLTKYVDAQEAEGGENNLLSVSLRNLNITSVDFHDFLVLGLNSIDITITPIDSVGPCTYQIRAVAIEAT